MSSADTEEKKLQDAALAAQREREAAEAAASIAAINQLRRQEEKVFKAHALRQRPHLLHSPPQQL